MATVWLVTTGSGTYDDVWNVVSIHATREGANAAKDAYEAPRERPDGSTYSYEAEIEEWELLE